MRALFALLLLVATSTSADEHWCATGPANDARLRAVHARSSPRSPIAANAAPTVPVLQDGVIVLQNDESIAFGYRGLDLTGQSLVFEPRQGSKFAMQREALHYIEPASAFRHDFQTRTGFPWHYVTYDLGFAFPIFGQSVTKLYLTAFNGIHFSAPNEMAATQFDTLEAAVQRQAVLSPLMITNRKPARLAYPKLFVEENADGVVITWRSEDGETFGYDVQAELRKSGSIVYSYRSARSMRWGTPIISRGFDPSTATRRTLGSLDDPANDLQSGTHPVLGPMTDFRRVELHRIDESDLFAVRLRIASPVDNSKFVDTTGLRFIVQIGTAATFLDITSAGWSITPFAGPRSILNGAAARIDGDVIEIYGVQLPAEAGTTTLRAWSLALPSTRTADFLSVTVSFDAPVKRVATDFSATENGTELSLPITEPFILGDFDPFAVWQRVQPAFAVSDADVDGVAMYQTFYTDLIFYAGAYATGGNAKVDGIAPPSQTRGKPYPKAPTLLHMNQFTYGYNALPENASKVILHEFGHRWLYFFRVNEGGQLTRSLNPVSAHPAGFVHTPAAFSVYGDNESSVMGGGVFTPSDGGAFRARALNMGYSWTDLYLMGLAAPEEVQPWFYLANTVPSLPQEYWPPDNVEVRGEQRPVTIDQVVAAEGPRDPSTATSQRQFRVLFVLVTENAQPTAEEMAKITEWRLLLEKNFALATGGRARVLTEWVRPAKKRALR